MEEIHQENNVVVEILIVSHYKVTWQIILQVVNVLTMLNNTN